MRHKEIRRLPLVLEPQSEGGYVVTCPILPELITEGDTVLEALLTIIPKELSRGNIVELGDFGSFWLRSEAEGADTAEAVRADQITNILPLFNPGAEFKRALDAIAFEKACAGISQQKLHYVFPKT